MRSVKRTTTVQFLRKRQGFLNHGWARMDTDGRTKTRLVVFFRRVTECILTDARHSLSQLIRAHPYHDATKSCIPDKIFWTVLGHRQGRGRRLVSVSIGVHLWFRSFPHRWRTNTRLHWPERRSAGTARLRAAARNKDAPAPLPDAAVLGILFSICCAFNRINDLNARTAKRCAHAKSWTQLHDERWWQLLFIRVLASGLRRNVKTKYLVYVIEALHLELLVDGAKPERGENEATLG